MRLSPRDLNYFSKINPITERISEDPEVWRSLIYLKRLTENRFTEFHDDNSLNSIKKNKIRTQSNCKMSVIKVSILFIKSKSTLLNERSVGNDILCTSYSFADIFKIRDLWIYLSNQMTFEESIRCTSWTIKVSSEANPYSVSLV